RSWTTTGSCWPGTRTRTWAAARGGCPRRQGAEGGVGSPGSSRAPDGLSQRQHQPVGPAEERRRLHEVQQLEVVQPQVAEALDLLLGGGWWRDGERGREVGDGPPAVVEPRTDPLVQQPLHVVGAFADLRGVAAVDRRTVDAAVHARGDRRGELALGAPEPLVRVEDAHVRRGALAEHGRV